MILNLGEYKIETDEYQYILYKKGYVKESRFTKPENVGKEKWTVIGYFTTLEYALKLVPQDIIRTNDDIFIIMEKLKQIEAIIKEIKE